MVIDNAYTREGGRKERFTIIDARTRQEYDKAHVLSAINLPAEDFNKSANLLPQDKDRLLVVYCSGAKECETSKKWASVALAAGYRNVAIYKEVSRPGRTVRCRLRRSQSTEAGSYGLFVFDRIFSSRCFLIAVVIMSPNLFSERDDQRDDPREMNRPTKSKHDGVAAAVNTY